MLELHFLEVTRVRRGRISPAARGITSCNHGPPRACSAGQSWSDAGRTLSRWGQGGAAAPPAALQRLQDTDAPADTPAWRGTQTPRSARLPPEGGHQPQAACPPLRGDGKDQQPARCPQVPLGPQEAHPALAWF